MIFDTHAHYDDEAFDGDRDCLLNSMQAGGVGRIVNVGAGMETSEKTVALTEQYDFLYGAVGVHPNEVGDMTAEDMDRLAGWSERSKIVAIGEIGLDYHYEEPSKEVQFRWFEAQMELAREKKLPISVVTSGQTQEGYAVVSTAATPNMVTISGAASLVKDVKTVQVAIDVEGLNTSITTSGELVLLDADGEKVDPEKLSLSLTSVAVNISIQKTKEVPIKVTPVGTVAEGYSISGDIEYQPTTILIAGDAADLRNVNEINIGDIDVTDKNADYEVTVDIEDYLPAGIVVADQTQDIAIKINIEKLIEKKFTIKSSDIRFINKVDGLNYKIAEDETAIELTVVGLKQDLDALTISQIMPEIDVTDMINEGTYTAPLILKELDGFQYQNTLTVTVEVTKKEETEETTAGTTETTTTESRTN